MCSVPLSGKLIPLETFSGDQDARMNELPLYRLPTFRRLHSIFKEPFNNNDNNTNTDNGKSLDCIVFKKHRALYMKNVIEIKCVCVCVNVFKRQCTLAQRI